MRNAFSSGRGKRMAGREGLTYACYCLIPPSFYLDTRNLESKPITRQLYFRFKVVQGW